jgi:hypothetical protein
VQRERREKGNEGGRHIYGFLIRRLILSDHSPTWFNPNHSLQRAILGVRLQHMNGGGDKHSVHNNYSVLIRKDILTPTTRRMNLKDMISDISQSQ